MEYNQSTNPIAALDGLKDDSPGIDEVTETIVDSATGGDNSDTKDLK